MLDPNPIRLQRIQDEMNRLYSSSTLVAMSSDSWSQRHGEVLLAIFCWGE